VSILRVYDPAECDEQGVPLDWERCRNCEGVGWTIGTAGVCDEGSPPPCLVCGGHGSLKAAALAYFMELQWPEDSCSGDPDRGTCTCLTLRCEDCGHPMREGTWEWRDDETRRRLAATVADDAKNLDLALKWLREGREPEQARVHYSPCDEACRHGGPVRFLAERLGGAFQRTDVIAEGMVPAVMHLQPQASWRPVDIRTLGWPHDLRPEKLAVLCLRCCAERSSAG
jgi:hypothetical protein